MVTVEELYKYYETFSEAKDKVKEHKTEFLAVLEGVKGGSSEKRLASQLIARYHKHFPDLAEKSINAQLDLCEDEDVTIRKQAIRDLPALCKDSPAHLTRIADVLTQLLQTDDTLESNLVHSSLLSLMRRDTKGTLQGIFPQILGDDELVREKAIQFLKAKFKLVVDDMSKETEAFVLEEVKKIMQDVSGEEFVVFIEILSSLKTLATVQGRSQLADIIVEQAGFANNDEFDALNSDSVERILQCTKMACELFSRNVRSTKFVAYFLDRVLPALTLTADTEEARATAGAAQRLELLRLLADMSQHCPELTELPTRVPALYDTLLTYMPLPTTITEGEAAVPAAAENTEATNGDSAAATEENKETPSAAEAGPKLQFSHVECVMFAFHQIARRYPEFLKEEENVARLKDLKIRLQYFARGVQLYMKQLRSDLSGKTGEALKTDESKMKIAALKTTSNINTLIRDLFHSPPSYKAVLNLSWKKPAAPPAASPTVATTTKRPANTPAKTPPNKAQRGGGRGGNRGGNRQVYAPPTGRYSEKAGSFDNPESSSGRGGGGNRQDGWGGRGGRRGRGGWRGKWY